MNPYGVVCNAETMVLLIMLNCHFHTINTIYIFTVVSICPIKTSVYREKKHPYDCFTNLSEDKSIPMTALWCPSFSNHG